MDCSKLTMGMAFMFAAGLAAPASAISKDVEGVRVQIEEVLYQIDQHGNSRPIDHQLIDVFPLAFENQYGSVDRSHEHGDYGAAYFEVPASDGGVLNHNVYVYVADGPFRMVTDGYHNGNVAGTLFKMTACTVRRIEDKVRVRVIHVINPPAGDQEPRATASSLRDLQQKVDFFLRSESTAR